MTSVDDQSKALPNDDARKLRLIKAALVQGAGPKSSGEADTDRRSDLDTGAGKLEVRCPNCCEPLQVEVDTALTDLTCGLCGSHFSLVDQTQATRMAPALAAMGRFELIERVGFGAFGSVWKARDKQLDRTVAVKIPRHGDMSADEQEKFLREARAAAQLRHPGIVSVHEVGRQEDTVFIVSDFIRGLTLGDWLERQKPTSREAAALMARIADALEHAHERGVVHRDLKPANIMIDGDCQPHVMDFGLARRDVGEVTMTIEGFALGTPAYMSPEQAAGAGHTADRRSDVYSLGVILFQLLTGELPFRGNYHMLIHQVIHDDPPSPRKFNALVPRDLDTIALKCLEKTPDRRYQTARELAEELRRFLAGEPILARPLSRIVRVWRWCKRQPLVASLSAAVLLLLLASTIISSTAAIYMSSAAALKESARRTQFATASGQLQAAFAAHNWQVYDQVRSEIIAKFSDLSGITEFVTRMDKDREAVSSAREEHARAAVEELEQQVAEGDMLRAQFTVTALPASIGDSQHWKNSAATVGKVRQLLDQYFAEHPLSDRRNYWHHESSFEDSPWQPIIRSVESAVQRHGNSIGGKIGVVRFLTEDESIENDILIEAAGAKLFNTLDQEAIESASIEELSSGGFIVVVPSDREADQTRSKQPVVRAIALRHQSIEIPVDFSDSAVTNLGTVVMKCLPAAHLGTVTLTPRFEFQPDCDDFSLRFVRDGYTAGHTIAFPTSAPHHQLQIAPGMYWLEVPAGSPFGIPKFACIDVEGGKNLPLDIDLYAMRKVEFEWRLRPLGTGEKWQAARTYALTDGQPGDARAVIREAPEIRANLSPWDGRCTKLRIHNRPFIRLATTTLPDGDEDVPELGNDMHAAQREYRVEIGSIYGLVAWNDQQPTPSEWEVLFCVKNISPVTTTDAK